MTTPYPPLILSDSKLSALETSKAVLKKGTVTQTGLSTDPVTLDYTAGVVTTVALTTAAQTEETGFVVNCDDVAADSVVLANVVAYGGTQGLPSVRVEGVDEGVFTLIVQNAGSVVLDGTVSIGFSVL